MASSSAHKRHLHLATTPYATTAAPPPTPSTQTNNLLSTSEAAADALSRLLLNRLPPPSLSLPSRRPSSSTTAAAISAPLINLSDPTPTLHSNLLSASQLGFFQLTHHSISSQLALSAESNSLSLFNLPRDQKQLLLPKNWPFGYDAEEDEDEDDESSTTTSESFVLDSSCSTESTELNLDDLREFTSEMEKLGLEVMGALASAVGFENPVREHPTRVCSLMWVSENSSLSSNNNNNPGYPGRIYPYVVGLQYQIKSQVHSLLADSGWVSVSPQVDSVLVTLGDIAQVWSNGKLKKVRGRPVPSINRDSSSISMCLLITLPVNGTVSPLLLKPAASNGHGEDDDVKKDDDNNNNINGDESSEDDQWVFNSFSFEDYAWRVYHERLLLKDPLVRYRV